jgi:hypothetical protein
MTSAALREIHFPEATSLSDLFDEVTPRKATDPPKTECFEGTTATLCLGASLREPGGYRFFHVRPKAAVKAFIAERMLLSDYEQIYFEFVHTANDQLLVVAKYNQIIGSRWLALLPLSEKPPEESL